MAGEKRTMDLIKSNQTCRHVDMPRDGNGRNVHTCRMTMMVGHM